MVANFSIDQPSLLEINRKIAKMGGGDYHLGKKPDSIFVRVSKKSASLCSASVCFLGGFGASKN